MTTIKIGTLINEYAESFGDVIRLGKKANENNIEAILTHELLHQVLDKLKVNTFLHHKIIMELTKEVK